MKWDDYFYIKCEYLNKEIVFESHYIYKVVIKNTDEVVGTYNDERYAKKQARYKFKKIASKVERILLG